MQYQMQKLLTFFRINFSIYALFNDQHFNDTLTYNIISFEQLGPVVFWVFFFFLVFFCFLFFQLFFFSEK